MKTIFCGTSKIPNPKQPLVVINKKNNCAKVVKTVARKVVKGALLPVGTLVAAAVGVAYGAFTGFCAGYLGLSKITGYKNYDLTIEAIPGKPPSPAMLFFVWALGNAAWCILGSFNACKGAVLLFPELGKLGYNVTNKRIDSAFGNIDCAVSKKH